MLKKVLSLIIVCVMLLAVATSCTGPGSGGKTTITITHYYQGTVDNAAAILKTIKDFQEKYPNIEVKSNYIEHFTYDNKLPAMIASDTLTELHATWAGAIANKYISADKVTYLDESYIKDVKDKVVSGAIIKDEQGRIYMSATSFWGIVMFNNMKILNKYGFKPATTWDELISLCKALKEKGEIPIALGNQDGSEVEWMLNAMQYKYGGAQKILDMHEGKTPYNEDTWVKSAEKFLELKDSGAFPENAAPRTYDEMLAMFNDGKAAMMFEGTWVMGTMIPKGDDFLKDITVTYWPDMGTGDNEKILLGGFSDGFLMTNKASANDKVKDACSKFLAFLLSKEASTNLVEQAGQMPISKDIDINSLKANPLLKDVSKFIVAKDWNLRNIQSNLSKDTAYADIMRTKLTSGLLIGELNAKQFAENLDKFVQEARSNK